MKVRVLLLSLSWVLFTMWTATPTEGADQDSKWAHHSGNLTFVVGYEKGMEQAKVSGKPMMLFFTTTWCGYCKKLAAESFVNDDVALKLANFIPVIVDGDTEKEIVNEYGVKGYPNVKFVTADGKRHAEFSGYVPTEQFLSSLASAQKSIGTIQYNPKYADYLLKSAKAAKKQKKYREAVLLSLEVSTANGASEKTQERARELVEDLTKFSNSQLEKAKKVFESDKARAKPALEMIRKEFVGLPAAKEAAEMLK